jgi:hypothetical protein
MGFFALVIAVSLGINEPILAILALTSGWGKH